MPAGMAEFPIQAPLEVRLESNNADSGSCVASSEIGGADAINAEDIRPGSAQCASRSGLTTPQPPYRLFVDNALAASVGLAGRSPQQSAVSLPPPPPIYFGLVRTLAFPEASERVLSAGDTHSLAARTSAFLRPALASEATFSPSPALGFGGSAAATAAVAFRASSSAPASATALRQANQGWLLGLATATDTLQNPAGFSSVKEARAASIAAATSTPLGPGRGTGSFALAWPSNSAFVATTTEGEGAAAAASPPRQRRHGEERARWGSTSPAVYAHIVREHAEPALGRFSCDVAVFPSPAAAAAGASPSGAPLAAENSAAGDAGRVPDASIVLRTSFHPGWRCSVATGNGPATPLDVGEVLPGFPVVDLFAVPGKVSNADGTIGGGSSGGTGSSSVGSSGSSSGVSSGGSDGSTESGVEQHVECHYEPSRLKGELLSLAICFLALLGLVSARGDVT